MISRTRSRRWPSVVVALLALSPLSVAMAQTGTIVGKVTDVATKQPISDVRLVLSGGAAETQSNKDGEFRLVNVKTGSVIVAAFRLGYKTKADTLTVTAGQTATANFQMTASLVTLSELVVTGTAGNQER